MESKHVDLADWQVDLRHEYEQRLDLLRLLRDTLQVKVEQALEDVDRIDRICSVDTPNHCSIPLLLAGYQLALLRQPAYLPWSSDGKAKPTQCLCFWIDSLGSTGSDSFASAQAAFSLIIEALSRMARRDNQALAEQRSFKAGRRIMRSSSNHAPS